MTLNWELCQKQPLQSITEWTSIALALHTASAASTGVFGRFIYASCAGCIGGMSILFGSVTSSIIQNGGLSKSFTAWLFYISLVLMIVCVITQTHLLNRAMELGDTTAVFPVFEAFWISFGVVRAACWWLLLSAGSGWWALLLQHR